MRYQLPSNTRNRPAGPDWPQGIGGIPALLLPEEEALSLPVLPGVNTLSLGVTGSGKTTSYTLPAAKLLLAANPETRGVFFEIKRSFIDSFLRPGDKVITHDPTAVPEDSLFRPCLVKEIRQAADREAEMRQIAEFLFSDLLDGANQNSGWIQAARNAWIGVLRTIVDGSHENTSNRQLVNALRQMPLEKLLAYLAGHPRNASMLRKDFGYDPGNPTGYRPTRRGEDIMFFFNQVLEKFSGAFEIDGEDTIHDFMEGKYGRRLFFLYDLAASESTRPHFLYYLKKLKDEQMSNHRRTVASMLMVMDEIDKLADGGKAADFGPFQAATLGREYGLQILVTTQSVEHLFGLAPNFNEHITMGGLAGFPMVLAFRPGDPTTVQTLQTLYGARHRRHLVLPASRDESPTVKFDLEPITTDAELASLGTGECYVKLQSCPPRKVRIIRPGTEEAPHGS